MHESYSALPEVPGSSVCTTTLGKDGQLALHQAHFATSPDSTAAALIAISPHLLPTVIRQHM
jgi:hypothetical protein